MRCLNLQSHPLNMTTINKCERCGEEMKYLNACHLVCPNCGAHMDCSDKGSVW